MDGIKNVERNELGRWKGEVADAEGKELEVWKCKIYESRIDGIRNEEGAEVGLLKRKKLKMWMR